MEASDDFPFQLPSKKLTLDIQTPAEKVFGPPINVPKTPSPGGIWMSRVRYPYKKQSRHLENMPLKQWGYSDRVTIVGSQGDF